jgi:hypothetical protein
MQVFPKGHQGKDSQGIGQELSIFIFNIFPNSTGQQGSSNMGRGDSVSTEVQVLQDARPGNGLEQLNLFASTTLSDPSNQQETGDQGSGVEGSAKMQIVQNGRGANATQVIGQNLTLSAQINLSNPTDQQATGNQGAGDAVNSKAQLVSDAAKSGKTQGNNQTPTVSTVSLLSNLTDPLLPVSQTPADVAPTKAQTVQDPILLELQSLLRDQETATNLSNYFHTLHTQASVEPGPKADDGTSDGTTGDSSPAAERANDDDLEMSEVTGESIAGLLGMVYFAMPANLEDRDSKERKGPRRRP